MLPEMKTKICTRCNIEKSVSDFHRCKKNGVATYCKKCRSEYSKIWRYEKDRDIKHKSKKRGISIEEILEEEKTISLAQSLNKKYCYGCKNILDKECFGKMKCAKDGLNTKCKKCMKTRATKYYQDNLEKIQKNAELYRKENGEKMRFLYRRWLKEKRTSDPTYSFLLRIRSRLYWYFKNNNMNYKINKDDMKMIGCSPTDLKLHLENQFVDGMSWENYGQKGWHIDHIIPLSSAKTVEDVLTLNHYTNLQPLWATDNRKKGKKII
jgi:hypothetical protein